MNRQRIETQDFLVEIGTEEMPPKSLAALALTFGKSLRDGLAEGLGLADAQAEEVYFSPRRIAVFIPNIPVRQPDRIVERLGPAVSMAVNQDGSPSMAAMGFAHKCGVAVEKLQRKHDKLYCKTTVPGKSASELIPVAVNGALARLPIPRRMRWGTGDVQFVRPVHWVLMMLGERVLKAEVLGLRTGNRTRGHRFHHPAAFIIKRPGNYRRQLLETGKVRLEDREGSLKLRIARSVEQAAKRLGGTPILEPALLDEVASLVEWPVAVTGDFDSAFLALPEAIIIAVLQGQQRYFLLRGHGGRLLPHFIAITNIQSRKPANVKHGNERVVIPRLKDAMFFWNLDRATPLESRVGDLAHMVFQKELGSYGDKLRRVGALAEDIAIAVRCDPAMARRAALLAKCDLLSNLVGEFPDLQGVIGHHVASLNGEAPEVAQAIEEQYLPRFSGDALPKTKTGQVLAVADKLDTIVGIFAIGHKPTGDRDPFALRRQALGVLRVAIECKLDLDFPQLVGAAYRQIVPDFKEDALRSVLNFFSERMRVYYEDRGIRPDVFAAVCHDNRRSPLDVDQRLSALQAFLQLPESRNLAAAHKRINNILRQAGCDAALAGIPDDRLFADPAERSLYTSVSRLEAEVQPLLEGRDYTAALMRLAALRVPVDRFFEGVMVMDDNPRIRVNRLALLAQLAALFLQIADLSRIQVE